MVIVQRCERRELSVFLQYVRHSAFVTEQEVIVGYACRTNDIRQISIRSLCLKSK